MNRKDLQNAVGRRAILEFEPKVLLGTGRSREQPF